MINMGYRSGFQFDWVLIGELAVGCAPKNNHHVQRLLDEGIKGVLSLCSEKEASQPDLLSKQMEASRVILPDHRSQRHPTINEVEKALEELKRLMQFGPVYVHCMAGVERSPLVCIAWLVTQKNLTPERALAYLMEVHPGTCPLPGQLKIMNQFIESKRLGS